MDAHSAANRMWDLPTATGVNIFLGLPINFAVQVLMSMPRIAKLKTLINALPASSFSAFLLLMSPSRAYTMMELLDSMEAIGAVGDYLDSDTLASIMVESKALGFMAGVLSSLRSSLLVADVLTNLLNSLGPGKVGEILQGMGESDLARLLQAVPLEKAAYYIQLAKGESEKFSVGSGEYYSRMARVLEHLPRDLLIKLLQSNSMPMDDRLNILLQLDRKLVLHALSSMDRALVQRIFTHFEVKKGASLLKDLPGELLLKMAKSWDIQRVVQIMMYVSTEQQRLVLRGLMPSTAARVMVESESAHTTQMLDLLPADEVVPIMGFMSKLNAKTTAHQFVQLSSEAYLRVVHRLAPLQLGAILANLLPQMQLDAIWMMQPRKAAMVVGCFNIGKGSFYEKLVKSISLVLERQNYWLEWVAEFLMNSESSRLVSYLHRMPPACVWHCLSLLPAPLMRKMMPSMEGIEPSGQISKLAGVFSALPPTLAAEMMARMNPVTATKLLTALSLEQAHAVFSLIPEVDVAPLVHRMDADRATQLRVYGNKLKIEQLSASDTEPAQRLQEWEAMGGPKLADGQEPVLLARALEKLDAAAPVAAVLEYCLMHMGGAQQLLRELQPAMQVRGLRALSPQGLHRILSSVHDSPVPVTTAHIREYRTQTYFTKVPYRLIQQLPLFQHCRQQPAVGQLSETIPGGLVSRLGAVSAVNLMQAGLDFIQSHAFTEASEVTMANVLTKVTTFHAAEALFKMTDEDRADVITEMQPAAARAIMRMLPLKTVYGVLNDMEQQSRAKICSGMLPLQLAVILKPRSESQCALFLEGLEDGYKYKVNQCRQYIQRVLTGKQPKFEQSKRPEELRRGDDCDASATNYDEIMSFIIFDEIHRQITIDECGLIYESVEYWGLHSLPFSKVHEGTAVSSIFSDVMIYPKDLHFRNNWMLDVLKPEAFERVMEALGDDMQDVVAQHCSESVFVKVQQLRLAQRMHLKKELVVTIAKCCSSFRWQRACRKVVHYLRLRKHLSQVSHYMSESMIEEMKQIQTPTSSVVHIVATLVMVCTGDVVDSATALLSNHKSEQEVADEDLAAIWKEVATFLVGTGSASTTRLMRLTENAYGIDQGANMSHRLQQVRYCVKAASIINRSDLWPKRRLWTSSMLIIFTWVRLITELNKLLREPLPPLHKDLSHLDELDEQIKEHVLPILAQKMDSRSIWRRVNKKVSAVFPLLQMSQSKSQ
ncbi:hypothetical protein CYMTET_6497 [Cymbomonas tetramitiformis]|uniref:Magnesium transporter MgtE intracellular domain-containing protein n=1 Tax=Cymbomonas tetramitiformis TaxID=36881 RepID=A0AAE0GX49_9CHLO|nr:hypothetical protein CYMTET_6497 [Cymbomonas tetramitiformis]